MSARWRPRDVPDAPDGLILFDGVCVFCSHWVRFVIARDAAKRWRFAAIQTRYGRALSARVGIDPEAPETNAVVIGGRIYFKSDAAIEVLRTLPGWSWSGVLRGAPRSIRDWAYDRIARNRYRLFGRRETCLVPSPEVASRFVTDDPL